MSAADAPAVVTFVPMAVTLLAVAAIFAVKTRRRVPALVAAFGCAVTLSGVALLPDLGSRSRNTLLALNVLALLTAKTALLVAARRQHDGRVVAAGGTVYAAGLVIGLLVDIDSVVGLFYVGVPFAILVMTAAAPLVGVALWKLRGRPRILTAGFVLAATGVAALPLAAEEIASSAPVAPLWTRPFVAAVLYAGPSAWLLVLGAAWTSRSPASAPAESPRR